MLNIFAKRLIVLAASACLLATGFIGAANAAMVGTDTAMAMERRDAHIADVKEWLDRDTARDQLVAMGVDPDAARGRVAAMTDEELRMVHGRISELPAGAGAVEVIGIVFIILLILELVGVTNIFSKF